MPRSISVRLETAADAAGESALWRQLVRYRMFIAASVVVGTFASLAVSLIVTARYRAIVVATYTGSSGISSSVQGLVSRLGGLASLAGMAQSGDDNGAAARTMLESRLVAGELIKQYALMPQLFPRQWDAEVGKWHPTNDGPPTLQQGIDKFTKNVMEVDYDNADNRVSVSIVWPKGDMAATLANGAIERVNAVLRDQAFRDGEKSLTFLKKELDHETIVALREAIVALMQQQMDTIMYANVREDYALRVLDPAVAPDPRDVYWPKKSQLALVGAFIGLLVGVLIAVGLDVRHQRLH